MTAARVPAMLDDTARLSPEIGHDGELVYRTPAVCHLTGATYRQIDHWARSGYITDTAHGSGYARTFTANEVDVIRLAKHLIDAGFTVPAAFEHAGHVIAFDGWATTVADIFTLAITVNTPSTKEHA